MRQRTWIASGVIVAFLSALPVPCHADDRNAAGANSAAEQARAHFSQGVTLYSEQDFSAALAEFRRAYELAPNWAVLFNLAQSYYYLRDYANAFATLERYVREGGDAVPSEQRAVADKELAELRGRVGHVRILSNLKDVTVTIDDVVVGKTPFDAAVPVSAGQRRITAIHDGRPPLNFTISVAGNDEFVADCQFPVGESSERPSPPPGAAIVQRGSTTARRDPTATFVAFGIGGAGLIVGSVFGAMALGDKSTLDKACSPAGACSTSSQSSIDALSRNATVSTIGFAVALLGGGVGVYTLLRPASKPTATAARFFEPWVNAGSAGVRGIF